MMFALGWILGWLYVGVGLVLTRYEDRVGYSAFRTWEWVVWTLAWPLVYPLRLAYALQRRRQKRRDGR